MSLSGWPEHVEHGLWQRSGHCVYCPCGARMYNGTAPASLDEQRENAEAFETIASLIAAKHERAAAVEGEGNG